MTASVLDATLRQWGDHLRSVLDERGMTVSEAARTCHASRSTFARRLASGNILIEWLWYLAQKFGIDPSELVPDEQ